MIDWKRYRNLLIYGGSFDPPHRAHVVLPQRVAQAIGADVVVYIPAGRAPHKLERQQTAAEHRVAMLGLALAGEGSAVVWDDEVRRVARDGKPSYTVQTLERLHELIHPDARLRLLIGTDQVAIFESWFDWERVLELAEPAVMVRRPETHAALPEIWRDRVVEVDAMEVSSTAVRQAVAAGEPIEAMVGVEVARYIAEKGLYL